MANSSDKADGKPPRIDRAILEDIGDRLRTTPQFDSAPIVTADGQTRLKAVVDSNRNPPEVEQRYLDVRWYTNDDFRIHYHERWVDRTWMKRWDRHPNDHNDRDHLHPPPNAATPGEDRSWPADYRDVMALVLSALADRNDAIWEQADD
jgi:hypothetical protein